MKVLILGGTGMLGHKLVQKFTDKFETWSTIRGSIDLVAHTGIFDPGKTIANVDVRDYGLLETSIRSVRPEVVINAVGVIKQVPAARDVADLIAINSILPHKLAEMGARLGYRLISLSTDCVFSGKRGNYRESDVPDADDIYGKSKYLGEIAGENCLTIRTSIIGRELASSNSLTEWFLKKPAGQVEGYANAIYSGFPTTVFADVVADIVISHRAVSGVRHISSEPISKFDLLRLMKIEFGTDHDILRNETYRIDRSLDSTKFRDATGFRPMPWPDMVRAMASDPTPYSQLRSHTSKLEV